MNYYYSAIVSNQVLLSFAQGRINSSEVKKAVEKSSFLPIHTYPAFASAKVSGYENLKPAYLLAEDGKKVRNEHDTHVEEVGFGVYRLYEAKYIRLYVVRSCRQTKTVARRRNAEEWEVVVISDHEEPSPGRYFPLKAVEACKAVELLASFF